MAATINDVRLQIGDIEEPYRFSDEQIQTALDEALDYLSRLGISVDSPLAIRAHKLIASIFLMENYLGSISERAISSIKEGDISITYVDLQKQITDWRIDLENILTLLQEVPFEMIYDNY